MIYATQPGTNRALREAAALSVSLEAVNFEGWDPYDALSSRILRTVARTPLARQAAIQFFKRLPINVRPIAGGHPQRHTKALALCVSAYTLLARLPDGERYRRLAFALADDLVRRAVDTPAGVGWGYDFDVQTRWGFYPAGQPNAVVTSFAAHALLDAATLSEANPLYGRVADSAGRSASSTLLVATPKGRFFAYYQGSSTPIHNANLLVASLVARLNVTDPAELSAARDAAFFTVSSQRVNGSWSYGDGRGLEWVDGYHTAYVLISLSRWLDTADDPEAGAALNRGLSFYMNRLFEPSGAPRASVDRLYPIDIHGASSAIWALAVLSHCSPEAERLAERVLDWTLEHMQRSDHRYAFQLHAFYRNSVAYVRWSDAHMLLALASFATAKRLNAN